jgi:hypothetical protein
MTTKKKKTGAIATGSEIDGALIDYVCMCVKRLSTFADSGTHKLIMRNHGDAGDHRIAKVTLISLRL